MKFSMWKNKLYVSALFAMLTGANSVIAANIPNPIKAQSFPVLIESIAKAITYIATPLAVVALIFVGFQFVVGATSGDAKKLGEARKMLWWVLIGTAIIIGAATLARVAVNIAETL